MWHLPDSLQSLTFGDDFNQSLRHVVLPSDLQSLTFGAQSIHTKPSKGGRAE